MGEGERVDQRPFLSFLFCLLFLGFEDSLLLSLFLGIRIPERISKSQGLLPDFPFFSKILFKFKLKHSNFSSESAFLFFFPPDRKVASIL
ncbi:hypothetical protein G4B88_011847 [Cannabis sativa]|uniref:Uncharacterized protein n=1 Tax=Cannabis sativa TaxID=3483 RepID=A0A7J6HC74_CANSA|nr:hypothetical protein G4B88_011847 [Cannabis sativa]